MHTNEREKEIIRELAENGYATVDFLARKLHISESSIRRDLTRLEGKGLIMRSYGGAELKNSVSNRIPFDLRSHRNTKEKLAVAQKAVSLVKQGDTIFLDNSTSTYFMIDLLKSIKDITVITNSVAGMMLISETGINAFLAGGQLNPENRCCCVGEHTESFIRSIHADICFFSVQSLTRSGELYDCFANEISPRRLMIKSSEKSVFLCDSSKIDHYSAYKLCELSDIDIAISDTDMEKYLEPEARRGRVEFMTAEA